jgi:hypothetical protein
MLPTPWHVRLLWDRREADPGGSARREDVSLAGARFEPAGATRSTAAAPSRTEEERQDDDPETGLRQGGNSALNRAATSSIHALQKAGSFGDGESFGAAVVFIRGEVARYVCIDETSGARSAFMVKQSSVDVRKDVSKPGCHSGTVLDDSQFTTNRTVRGVLHVVRFVFSNTGASNCKSDWFASASGRASANE